MNKIEGVEHKMTKRQNIHEFTGLVCSSSKRVKSRNIKK